MNHVRAILIVVLAFLPAAASAAAAEEAIVLTMPKTGTFWYRMEDAGGAPMGYARLDVKAREGGGLGAGWTMKLAFPGGTYEEERRLGFDAGFQLTEAGYVSDGTVVSDGRWDEAKPAPRDAGSGIIFLLQPVGVTA